MIIHEPNNQVREGLKKGKLSTFSGHFFSITSYITHKIYLKAAQNSNRQSIYNKTAYVQSLVLGPTVKLYTSSAWHAHDTFHVCMSGIKEELCHCKLYNICFKVLVYFD